jgi:alkanesulfonate monooxygenase SsuD/methylene tetrahydromethanopterin reductase-like flavin-dependent oxidoreductase (luciferase family)
MKFGMFFEHMAPRPWTRESEREVFNNGIDQVELADRLGYDYAWVVEHHFQEEASHSSAPDIFLAACSQRSKRIRLGHGVTLTAPGYTHPARLAERLATLDLISGGRVDWGTGESNTLLELEGFGIDFTEKKAQWREGWEQALNMMTTTPYAGYQGKYFSMPVRNVVPKPYQQPHPPMWVACSRRESILNAARMGMGALVFGFLEPEQAAVWVKEYYDIIRSTECVPGGYTVNANIACVIGLSVHPDQDEAVRRGSDGFKFFGYGTGHYYTFGTHRPGIGSLWDRYIQAKDSIPDNAGQGGIGTPDKVRAHVQGYVDAGVDQLIFIAYSGKMLHAHACESLELFAEEVMPHFKAGEVARERRKAAELAPYIEAALARRAPPPPQIPEDRIPHIKSLGVTIAESGGAKENLGVLDNTRGGAVPIVSSDPNAIKE